MADFINLLQAEKYSLAIEKALLCNTRTEFKENFRGLYEFSKNNNIMDSVCSHMETRNHYMWSDIELHKEALKYSTRGEFQINSSSAYMTARNRGIINEICTHMKILKVKWTREMLEEEAIKHTRRVDFAKGNCGAFAKAKELGIVDEICSHMVFERHYWTDEEIYEAAKEFKHRVDFQRDNIKAYQAAIRRGMVDDVCSHMEYKKSATVYSNEMYMYFVKIVTLDESLPDVWKIGITKFKNVNRRFFRELDHTKAEIVILKTWYFKSGYEAFAEEQSIIKRFKDVKYYGDSPLRETKNTEMFVENILPQIKGNFNEK